MLKKTITLATVSVLGISVGVAMANSSQSSLNKGASFNDVWNVVTVAPKVDLSQATDSFSRREALSIQKDIELYGTTENPKLPQYSGLFSALKSIANGTLKAAALRTVSNHDDFHDYFEKLVHSNGICFSGMWEITEDSPYSGYFKKGSSALMIGRISAASPQTTNDKNRSFGFAGKLFPTTNPNEVVSTANFFTVHNLNGTAVKHALDVSFVNEPPVDLSGFLNPLKIVNDIFDAADLHPGVRPLYPISRAGLDQGASAVTPKWMRIHVAPQVQSPDATDSDFRNELSAKNYPNGLVFLVDVSDETKDPNANSGWKNIGQIRTSALTTTFGCDRRLHFPHPRFNDPNL